ncbi:MAG: YidC/Oxa1 family membrane protein insertase [Leptospirales bacterium]|nr:YidC/Oxa1 family membrane protein insertase [Leptospirales bacterium]
MENQDQNQKKPGTSSFLAIAVIGVLGVILVQNYLKKDQTPPPPPNPDVQSETLESGGEQFQFARLPDGNPGQITRIVTENLIVELSTRGARIARLYLKQHDLLTIPGHVIQRSNDPTGLANHALEVTRGNGMDFQLHAYWGGPRDEVGDPPLNAANFRLVHVKKDPDSGIVEVRYTLPVSLKGYKFELTKIYRFLPGENYFHQLTAFRNLEHREFRWGAEMYFKTFGDLGPQVGPGEDPAQYAYGRFYYYNDSLDILMNTAGGGGMSCGNPFSCNSRNEGEEYHTVQGADNSLELMGSKSRYFFAYDQFLGDNLNPVHTPDGLKDRNKEDESGKRRFTAFFKQFRLAASQDQSVDFGGPDRLMQADGSFVGADRGNRALILSQQKSRSDLLLIDNKVYVGPRNDDAHRFQNPALMAAEFGQAAPDEHARGVLYNSSFLRYFSTIRDGIVWLMRFLYQYVGNYGWVIIIIAVSFKLVTWPLNQIQARSMKKMSLLRPEMDRINEKYADNPQEKQKKVMELYKKHNINPMKGCLPMLIQMPIFIALYSAFSESIELWQSPFIFWIHDLSVPDTVGHLPYLNVAINILPLIMAASQLVQQRLTMVSVDQQQKTIMYMMPIMMLFFFWQIPSGVTLYWTVQNLIAIIWQLATNRFGRDDAAAVARS